MQKGQVTVPEVSPPLEEQKAIAAKLVAVFELIDRLDEQVRQLCERSDTFDAAVLSKAFRGELVPQNPKDEPASVLLERIKAEREQQADGAEPSGRRKRRGKGG